MIDLGSKNALIVGGTSGIGRGIAFALAEAGARVVCASRVEAQVARMAAELRQRGMETLEIACDVTDLTQVRALVAAIRSAWGRLDILVNAQGIHHKRPSTEVGDDQFSQVLGVNLESIFRVCREAQPLLKGGGCIINIASMGSFIGLKDAAAYTASKGGVAQLTKALAVDWAADGIRVNAIAPGWILTRLSEKALADPQYREPIEKRIPMGRIGTVEDVAGAALFLASDLARYVTGAVIPVDGGALASV